MTDESSGKNFDCIKFTRATRARIARETEGMNWEEFRHWLRSRVYSDPELSALAAEAKPPEYFAARREAEIKRQQERERPSSNSG